MIGYDPNTTRKNHLVYWSKHSPHVLRCYFSYINRYLITLKLSKIYLINTDRNETLMNDKLYRVWNNANTKSFQQSAHVKKWNILYKKLMSNREDEQTPLYSFNSLLTLETETTSHPIMLGIEAIISDCNQNP